jgi:hypothetical protein
MTSVPPEDLIVFARRSRNDVVKYLRALEWTDGPFGDWRDEIPPTLRRLWGRLSLEGQLAAFVVAERAHRGGTAA